MAKSNVIRFALGKPDDINSSVWRVWTHNNDIYVAARSILGTIKTSLHEDGNCQTSFTREATIHSEDSLEKRHISRWKAKKINDGLWRLLDIVIPHHSLKNLHVEDKIAKKIKWVEPFKNSKNTEFTFFKSNKYLGDNNWVSKRSMGTLLLHKDVLNDGNYYYIVYHGHNLDVKKVIIKNTHNDMQDSSFALRSIRSGVSKESDTGFLIDG